MLQHLNGAVHDAAGEESEASERPRRVGALNSSRNQATREHTYHVKKKSCSALDFTSPPELVRPTCARRYHTQRVGTLMRRTFDPGDFKSEPGISTCPCTSSNGGRPVAAAAWALLPILTGIPACIYADSGSCHVADKCNGLRLATHASQNMQTSATGTMFWSVDGQADKCNGHRGHDHNASAASPLSWRSILSPGQVSVVATAVV